jgi:2'-5' RNA ligase
MQEFTQKWSLVAFLEPVQEGAEFFWRDWPQHVTLADVFAAEWSGAVLAEKLSTLLTDQQPMTLNAEAEARWGENGEAHVMLLQKTPEIISLHSKIYDGLTNAGAVFNEPQYQGEGFVPHSTVQTHASLNPGSEIKIESISVIDMLPNNDGHQRKVLKTIEF